MAVDHIQKSVDLGLECSLLVAPFVFLGATAPYLYPISSRGWEAKLEIVSKKKYSIGEKTKQKNPQYYYK